MVHFYQEKFIHRAKLTLEDIERLQELEASSDDPNEQLLRLSELQMQTLRCNNAEQVMNLILSNERIYSDLLLALTCLRENPGDERSTSKVTFESIVSKAVLINIDRCFCKSAPAIKTSAGCSTLMIFFTIFRS